MPGSGIVVFGTVPQSVGAETPPTAVFTLDAQAPFVTTQPSASLPVPNQPLFASSGLSTDEHKLIINVTSAETPFTFDSFVVFPQSNLTHNVASPIISVSPADNTDAQTSESVSQAAAAGAAALRALKILAALLGVLVFILVGIIALLLFRLRVRKSLAPRRSRSRNSISKSRSTGQGAFPSLPSCVIHV